MTPPVVRKAGRPDIATPAVARAFRWSDPPAHATLVCRPMAGLAPHLFAMRPFLRGGPGGADYDSRIAESMAVTRSNLVRVKQVHGSEVVVIRPGSVVDLRAADALVSVDPEKAIAVSVADCVPILIADRCRRAVAAVHAGWRGTAAGVAAAAVEALAALGVPPRDLVAAIGPSIGPCCYQVDRPVRDAFVSQMAFAVDWFTEDGEKHWKLDLWQANAALLRRSGVPDDAVHTARICTADDERGCCSYRRDGATAGRMTAAIRIGAVEGVA